MHFVNSRGLLNAKNGMNIFRGCTHGCIYCDSRSNCYQINHSFEDVEVKQNAPLLLEQALKTKRKKCMIGTGSMSDSYIPLEQELLHTQACLRLILKYGFGVAIQTKSNLILRDIDLLEQINRNAKCVVQITLTTFNDELCKKIEPNVSTTSQRIEVLKQMQKRGIPTVVWFTPILPFINDTEANTLGILNACKDADVKGILYFGQAVTLREGNREYFYKQLDSLFPAVKELYIKKFGYSYICESDNNNRLNQIFIDFCRNHGIMHNNLQIFKYLSQFPSVPSAQLKFDLLD